MRTITTLVAVMMLAGCSGGGSGTNAVPPAPAATSPVTTPAGALITPKFLIVVPQRTSASAARTVRRVSPAALSVTITLLSPPAGVSPTSVTTAISAGTCTTASPCTVDGPQAPPGSRTYDVSTWDTMNGTGHKLDSATPTVTLAQGVDNTVAVTLMGIPNTLSVALGGSGTAGTPSSAPITVTVRDAASQTITGAYAASVLLCAVDANGTQGVQISGTTPANASCPGGTGVVLASDTDTATLNYGGLAENPVTVTASATAVTAATASFAPALAAIVGAAGNPHSAAAGAPVGIDLFTTASTSPVGYSGTVSYSEAGYTNPPYNRTLTTINPPSGNGDCSTFATLTATDNTGTGQTDFTATAIATPAAGLCTRVVSDGLAAAGHGSGGPSFVVTYTTATFGSSIHRSR